MSFKANIIKIAIKLTPNSVVKLIANIVLKDIAALTGFNFDLETRQVYVQIQLVGESETIDVWLEDFAIITEEGAYKFVIQQATSNRIWLGNILSRIAKKEWEIPVPAHMSSHVELIAELLKAERPEQEDA
ncbi:hypothetical protein AU255_03445 [Methyloprofundus sedimenti]|uniref:Uncharacterized protein n=1 Tax=Methyloprofundus sedimenti TaxID=1420851 RepID=A0A1V8M640_9GAMM|nr:hypothetical protein [Methyloprofundus sedimenti]OQK16966.1 hypothetical protein AU255_03445 [Methyloprofundus sedimenti]